MPGVVDKEGRIGLKAELANGSKMNSPNNHQIYYKVERALEGLGVKVTAISSYMLILLVYVYFHTQAQAQLLCSS